MGSETLLASLSPLDIYPLKFTSKIEKVLIFYNASGRAIQLQKAKNRIKSGFFLIKETTIKTFICLYIYQTKIKSQLLWI